MQLNRVRAIRRLSPFTIGLLALIATGTTGAPEPKPSTRSGPVEVLTDLAIKPFGVGQPAAALRVSFTAQGRAYELLLRRAGSATADVRYRGRVRGIAGSWAWVEVTDGMLDGVVVTPDGSLALVPATRVLPDADPGSTAAYQLDTAPARPHLLDGVRQPVVPHAPAKSPSAGARSGVPDAGRAMGAPAPADQVAAATTAAAAPGASGFNHMAVAALGQQDLLSNILNQPGAAGLFFPYDIDRDRSVSQTRMYVADTFNSRVVGFECGSPNCALATFTAATRVFGQPDFSSYQMNGGVLGGVSASTLNFPNGVAVDNAGTLYVADTGNNRVLVYTSPWTNATADVVIGQTAMNAASAGSGLNQLRSPAGVFVDAGGALWVADTGNNRVLKFTT